MTQEKRIIYWLTHEFGEGNDNVKLVKEALEKQIPKKPNIPWDTQTEECPICQSGFLGEPPYCSRCGQAIDWSDNDEKTIM